jgi:hypothetical protein
MTLVFEAPSDLSDYLFRIVDNGGSSADRYTVAFSDGTYLALSSYPTHPQGVSISGEDLDPATLQEWVENGEAVDMALGDLPPHIVQHILDRNNQGFADFLESVEAHSANVVAPNRDAAEVNEGTMESLGKGIYATTEGFRIRLDGHPNDDRGPYATAREAVLASLPDQYSLAGPEYHTTVDNLVRTETSQEVADRITELETKRTAEWKASGGI